MLSSGLVKNMEYLLAERHLNLFCSSATHVMKNKSGHKNIYRLTWFGHDLPKFCLIFQVFEAWAWKMLGAPSCNWYRVQNAFKCNFIHQLPRYNTESRQVPDSINIVLHTRAYSVVLLSCGFRASQQVSCKVVSPVYSCLKKRWHGKTMQRAQRGGSCPVWR